MRRKRREQPSEAEPPETGKTQQGEETAHETSKVRRVTGRLGDLLVAANLATPEQVLTAVEEAQHTPGKRLGERLIELGALDERDLAWVLARQYGLDAVDLREVRPEPEATELLTEKLARELHAIPLSIKDGKVVVAVADLAESILARLQEAIALPLVLVIAPPSDIAQAVSNSYRALSGVMSRVKTFEARDVIRRDASEPALDANEDAPVVQVVHLIITQALRDRASDIHIEPQAERIRVRYRIDGALHDMLDLPGSMGPSIVSRVKILANMNIVERRRPQDGQISMEIERRAVDIRVSSTAVVGGEKVVMRLLDKSRPLFNLDQLGMPEETIEKYSALLRSPYGMVICAGPTGSGKTTTLYSSLGEINSPERNIMTIEDPVEYTFPSINQIQINEQAGITFAGGLKSILRQDPDVILVGEVRDVDTARIAVQSALTGHFVLSSLHATDAASALHRLLDMGIESFLVASSVAAVLSQRLVRRVCTYCKQNYDPRPEELSFLDTIGGRAPLEGFVHGTGCNFCAQTGFLDRVGVYEMMPVSEGIRELVLDRASHAEIRKLARYEGMRSLQDEAARLIESSVTTVSEALRSIYVAGA
jgi:type IV pilus assembly protein PilB